ncbi:MAG: hypothetical protein Q8P82_01095, partial [bacterium]|nr:hypothetical protein [bacterium]
MTTLEIFENENKEEELAEQEGRREEQIVTAEGAQNAAEKAVELLREEGAHAVENIAITFQVEPDEQVRRDLAEIHTEATKAQETLAVEIAPDTEAEKARENFEQNVQKLHELLRKASESKTREEFEIYFRPHEVEWREQMDAASKYIWEHPEEWAGFLASDVKVYKTPEEDLAVGSILISENRDVNFEQRKGSIEKLRLAIEQLPPEHANRTIFEQYVQTEQRAIDRQENEMIFTEADQLFKQKDAFGAIEILTKLNKEGEFYSSEKRDVQNAIGELTEAQAKELEEKFSALPPEKRKQMYRTVFYTTPWPSVTVNRFSQLIPELGKEEVFGTYMKKDVSGLVEKFGTEARDVLGTKPLLEALVAFQPKQVIEEAGRVFADVPPQELIALVREKFTSDNALHLLTLMELRWGTESLLEPETLAHVPLSIQLEFLQKHPDVEEKIPWAGALKRMGKMQARTARREYDPWLTAINPLAKTLQQEGVISFANPEHAEQFATYVEEFGAVDAPALFRAFLELRTAENVSDVSSQVREDIRAVVGRTFEKLNNPEAVLNSLRQKRRELVKGLLTDEIPEGLGSKIGIELFRSARGATRWDRGTSEQALIETWRDTRETRPDISRLPEGYREHSFAVAERVRDTGDRAARQEQAKREILESGEVKKRFRVQQESFQDAQRPLPEIIGMHRGRILEEIDTQIQKTRQRLETLPEKAKGSAEKNLSRLEEQRNRIVDSGKGKAISEIAGDEYVRLLETVASLGMKSSAIDTFARAVSAAHMRAVAPEQFARSMDRIGGAGDIITPELIQESRDVLVDYLGEHYLHPKQEEHQTGHAPFSPEARKLLERSWQLLEGVSGHPVVRAHDSLRALEQGKLSTKTVEVTMVPVQGMLRVMSGDIGDACYTSKHEQFAKGEVPDLHGVAFVLGRNTAEERFGGS